MVTTRPVRRLAAVGVGIAGSVALLLPSTTAGGAAAPNTMASYGSTVTYYLHPPTGQPFHWGYIPGIASGLGSVWPDGGQQNAIGRITTPGGATGGDVSVYPVNVPNTRCTEKGAPPSAYCVDHVHAIGVGPDGNIYFTVTHTGLPTPTNIVKMSPDGTQLGEFPDPESAATGNYSPVSGITAGADGNVWYTSPFSGPSTAANGAAVGANPPVIVRLTPSGATTPFPIPAGQDIPCCGAGADIVATADGVYFPTVGVLNTSDGSYSYTESFITLMSYSGAIVAQWALPAGSQAQSVVLGRDNEIWFNICLSGCGTNSNSGGIGSLNPNTGVVRTFATGAVPDDLTVGGDHNIWITNSSANTLTRMAPDGTIIAVYTIGDGPSAITTGSNGNVYFGENPGPDPATGTIAGRVVEFLVCSGNAGNGVGNGSCNEGNERAPTG